MAVRPRHEAYAFNANLFYELIWKAKRAAARSGPEKRKQTLRAAIAVQRALRDTAANDQRIDASQYSDAEEEEEEKKEGIVDSEASEGEEEESGSGFSDDVSSSEETHLSDDSEESGEDELQ